MRSPSRVRQRLSWWGRDDHVGDRRGRSRCRRHIPTTGVGGARCHPRAPLHGRGRVRVVSDAHGDRRFTGEVVFETTPEVRVYADRGRIYLAERASDPTLGARLVDAGALNATQLEHGAMRIGEAEHLGRLFERVPSVDRQKVIVTAELMTEECVGWLAR